MKLGAGVDLAPYHQTELQRNQTELLVAMSRLGKHVYGGTVDPEIVAARRRRNRAGRKVRAAQRRARR